MNANTKQSHEALEKLKKSVNARLLIVDDDPVIRLILREHFTNRGFIVQVAAEGEEALRLLALTRYDLVITDLIMPGMDGLELMCAIRRDYPLLRVIVITGAVTIDNMLSVLKEGAFTFITKPLDDLANLEVAVDLALAMVQGWMVELAKLQRLRSSQPKLGSIP